MELPNTRPAVFPKSLEPDLSSVLGFRHFVRHAYVGEYDPTRVHEQVRRVTQLQPHIEAALQSFVAFLDTAVTALNAE